MRALANELSFSRFGTWASAALFALAFSSKHAAAGGMKDVYLLHLEAIAEHLYGNPDTEGLQSRNSGFVPAEPGFVFAVRSEVLAYSSVVNGFDWVSCITQHIQTGSGGYPVAKTFCQ